MNTRKKKLPHIAVQFRIVNSSSCGRRVSSRNFNFLQIQKQLTLLNDSKVFKVTLSHHCCEHDVVVELITSAI